MSWEKFGTDRHRPAGMWVQTTVAIPVMGIAHRKAAALNFANAVRKAEQRRLFYSLRLESEPNNPHDANAIKVWGVAAKKGWFGSVRRKEWHIGYVDAVNASELKTDLLEPIRKELNHAEAFATRRLSMIRIMASRMKATTVEA